MKMKEYLSGWLDGSIDAPGVARLIGMRLEQAGDGNAKLSLQTGPQHHNPMQTVHGGVLCDLADAAMGVALGSALEEGETFTTVQLDIRYFHALRQELIQANGHVVRRGANVAFVECEIEDEGGRLVAKAASTCFITRPDDGASVR